MNKTVNNIVIIGSGNVAYHLLRVFQQAGLNIVQVYSRNTKTAKLLHEKFKVPFITDPSKVSKEADLYILAVNDDNISLAASSVNFGNHLLVHTSGSASMDLLLPFSTNTGVFYPLQTLSFEKEINFRPVPICLEANSAENMEMLYGIASQISDRILRINSHQRQIAHLAAVFASNFTNHMYAIAASILEQNNLPFDILAALITETAAKAVSAHPSEIQTGPAIRNDLRIIEKHLKLLEDRQLLQEIYGMISKSIIDNKQEQNEEL